MKQQSKQLNTGVIFNIKKYAIHDGPGIRTTVFLKGCPLRCSWCHNPESWKSGPEARSYKIRSERDEQKVCGQIMSIDEVMTEIKKDIIFYDESDGGVTFSGGEPLSQPEFLAELLAYCNKEEIHAAVDTSCYASKNVIEKIASLTNLFLCDIKHMDSAKHEKFTGVGNELILNNIKLLAKLKSKIIIRIPIVPGFNDTVSEMEAISEFIDSLGIVSEVGLLPYNSGGTAKAKRLTENYQMLKGTMPSSEKMNKLGNTISKYNLNLKIGG